MLSFVCSSNTDKCADLLQSVNLRADLTCCFIELINFMLSVDETVFVLGCRARAGGFRVSRMYRYSEMLTE